ncbi:hypothetical protein [Actinoplanes teichomyceticus]|uniref:Uncharacterized protein n=1 Tax=Actinoplanes teichomyceticus TaxID=1867 RepID=A0A561VQ95_ACTTI|nr:hypothetical protein [Actinoplanes teichomyceticus]TWG13783.1 hypothetical protein FHX34_10471 [Actinoplanes teichomyceticus]GIF12391.1 hypothetical protein Ate01nite_24230 [Actinoplanes teichomyceticus]
MSFDQLMQHAHDIQTTAIAKAMEQRGVRQASKPGDPPYTPRPGEDAVRAKISADFADIASLFEPFSAMPDPAAFDGLISYLDQAMGYLSTGFMPDDPITGQVYPANETLTRIGASESYLEEWTGHAADRFRTDFVNTFPPIVVNQFVGCAVLHSALMAQQALWASARDDIDKVAHHTLNALDNMDHCGQNRWTMSWTIVASVAAVAAVPVSAGTSVLGGGLALGTATAVTAVGATGQVVAAHQVTPPKETEYHGETAEAVIEQMRHGVAEAISEIQHGEQMIATALRQTHASMSEHRGLFVAPRPKLLDATPGSVFDDRYLGRER